MRIGWLAVALLCPLTGCRKDVNAGSARTAFEAFDQAMRVGDHDRAAEVIDFDTLGRQGNSEWDTFSTSQRNLIAGEMRSETVTGLASMGYPSEGMSVSGEQVDGDRAAITAVGGGKTLRLTLQRGAEGWKIVGGIPGMTSSSGMSGR